MRRVNVDPRKSLNYKITNFVDGVEQADRAILCHIVGVSFFRSGFQGIRIDVLVLPQIVDDISDNFPAI